MKAVILFELSYFDGLIELLQASKHDRSSYLDDVVEFQEREAIQGRPGSSW